MTPGTDLGAWESNIVLEGEQDEGLSLDHRGASIHK
jgi:hypothetical protein